MAINASNDFLRFSAYQIKDLITRKLSEDTNFTDQVYEGSNLAILIDIVSYMYQCLIYNLNNAAAESMFSDTQLYENIVRLSKFIGYHPTAFKPATANASIAYNDKIRNDMIYPCTALDTGLYDSNSKKIYFSTAFDRTNSLSGFGYGITDEKYTNFSIVNGRWKHYSTVFEASGIDYETFVLDGLKADSADAKYVANNGIQVFVIPKYADKLDDVKDEDKPIMWHNDPNEIFIQTFDSRSKSATFSKLYNNDEHVYTSYLNENKTFEIKFGNGISGKRLNPGDRVHVMYLDTNGPDGYIDISEMPQTFTGNALNHSPSFFGISPDLYEFFFEIDPDPTVDNGNIAARDDRSEFEVKFNPDSLTYAFPEQNVDDIRETAPNWFKTGNRLITKQDYEFLLKSNNFQQVFPGVVDTVCMNNWDYVTSFYRWLYNMGLNPVKEVFQSELNQSEDESMRRKPNAFRYLQKSRLVQSGYLFVDSADANNIYLWIATGARKEMSTIKYELNVNINNIKTMTSETYPLNPIDVYFDLTFTPAQLYYDELVKNEGNSTFDTTNSYLEVTISDNSIFSNVVIAQKIEDIIQTAFDPKHCKLGQIVNYSDILDQIYQINGVTGIRTVYYPDDYLENTSNYEKYKTRACDGIAFASWSYTPSIDNNRLIDIGDDLQISNTTRVLEKFQFPCLSPSVDISKKIKVIRKSMNSINPVKF